MTIGARKEMQREIAKERLKLERLREDYLAEMKEKQEDMEQDLQRDLIKIIQSLSKEEDYDLVFEKNEAGLLFFSEAVDITDKVLAKHNIGVK